MEGEIGLGTWENPRKQGIEEEERSLRTNSGIKPDGVRERDCVRRSRSEEGDGCVM